MRKRYDAASKLVVFHDVLVPLVHGVKTEEAFALILEQNGCEPAWSEDALGVTLRLRIRGREIDVLPHAYARGMRSGNYLVQRSFIMSSVCAGGVGGWRALGSDDYCIKRSRAERTVHTVWDHPWRKSRRG